ncbi:spore coat protein U-like protein [Paraburkholderia bannensis]|uniref:Spore coat protein U-like protein n=1 Tax=Paraburkholderia bannensis TaxID=765414 RepID=A0A7W9WQQ7_9BURK|nr:MULTISPECIES: spore coat protein U domain-containing protein [Paraburkholderia]MBB3255493.1 spore coat protein U-like protein [Paraburkholderia sp. WP4_3_2]MBB6100496.1 spore coat protein U-like protein [Paraburkholderia bannensis]
MPRLLPRLASLLRVWPSAALALLALCCVTPRAALAQTCSFTLSNIVVGNISTISGVPADANGTLTANCSGYSTSTIRLCLSLGIPSGGFDPRTLKGPSSSTLAYNIYSDAAHTTIWGSINSSTWKAVIVDLPVVSGSASTSLTLYARVNAGQNGSPVGTYTQTFATTDTLLTYLGYSGAPPTCTGASTPSARLSFTVTAAVAADCNITAAPLAFPAVTALNSQVTANTSVQVTCVSGAPYTIALDAGTTPGATVANRLLLLNGGSTTVAYGLFKDAAWGQPWGDGTRGTTTNAGTGNGNSQAFTVYGRILPQSVPPPGNYSDTITATVSF